MAIKDGMFGIWTRGVQKQWDRGSVGRDML